MAATCEERLSVALASALASTRARGSAFTAVALAYVLLAIPPVLAHDFWIEPSSFRPVPASIVKIGLRVGQNFNGDAVPRYSRAIEQFFIRQDGGDQAIEGADGIDPAGFLRASGTATAVIGYRSAGSPIELPAAQFETYLHQYGLESIIEQRRQRGETGTAGKESFSRYAKALLTGKQTSPAATHPLGFALEIAPDRDPTRGVTHFSGRILYEGKPLHGAMVVALSRSAPSQPLTTRSDAQGRFLFELPQGGVWLIKSVHMVRASFFADADWNSLWASLTFEAPQPSQP